MSTALDPNQVVYFGITRRWWVVLTIAPSLTLLGLNATILDLPELVMIPELQSDEYRFQWATGASLLGSLIGMSLLRWLRDNFGLKTSYLGGMLVAVVGASFCAHANTVVWLAPGRFIEGVGKGVVVTNVLALLWREFPHRKDVATSLYGAGIYFGKAVAPCIGGYLTDYPTSWHWIFFVNSYVSLATFCLSWWVLLPDKPADSKPERFDWLGLILLVVWTTPLAVCLFRGQLWGWTTSRDWLGFFLLFAAALPLWIVWELWAEHPLIDLRLFRARTFALAVGCKAMYMIAFGGVISLLIHYMAVTRQYPRTTTGLVLLPGAVAMGLSLLVSGLVGIHWSRKGRLLVGMVGLSISTWWLSAIDLYTAKEWIAAVYTLWGFSAGLAIPPLLALPMEGLSPPEVASSASIKNMNRELPGTIGTLLTTVLLTRRTDNHFDLMRQDIIPNRAVVENVNQRLAEHLVERGSSGARLHEQAGRVIGGYIHANANAFAYETVLKYVALACVVGVLLALFIRPAKR